VCSEADERVCVDAVTRFSPLRSPLHIAAEFAKIKTQVCEGCERKERRQASVFDVCVLNALTRCRAARE
jgi:hypothetical protein